jgi:hypothetical protein
MVAEEELEPSQSKAPADFESDLGSLLAFIRL